MYDYAISFLKPDLAWAAWITAVLAGHGSRALMLEAGHPQRVSPGRDAQWIPLMSAASLRPEAAPDWWWCGPEGGVDPAASPVIVGRIADLESAPFPDLATLARDHDQARVIAELREYLDLGGSFAEGKASAFGLGMPLYPPLRPAAWNVPPRNPYFTGRQEILDRLRSSFARQPGVPQYIVGPPGIGKTSLAIEYAHRYSSLYQGCRWLDGDRQAESWLRRSRYTAADSAGPERPWLLIVDDASGTTFPLPPPSGHRHVLITAEQPDGAVAGIEEPGPLSVSEAASLAERLLGPGHGRLADEIGRLAAGVPLTVWLLAYLSRDGSDAFPATDSASRLAESGTENAARLAIASMSAASPATAELLSVMASSAPEPLSVTALRAGATALPAPLAAAVRAQPDLAGVTEPLARAGLLRRDHERLVLHPVARRAVTKAAVGNPRMAGQAANVVLLAARAFRHNPPGDSEWADLLPHLQCAAEAAERQPAEPPAATVAGYLGQRQAGLVHPPDVVVALDIAARHFSLSDRYDVARDLAACAVRVGALSGGGGRADPATRLINLAGYERLSGRPAEALRLLEEVRRALADRRTDDADILADGRGDLLRELALTHSALRDHVTAAALAERHLRLGQAGLREGGFDPEVAYYVQGTVLHNAGRLAEAREALEHCLAAAPPASGEPDRTAGMACNALARVLLDLGEPEDALDVLESGLALFESSFGPDHPLTGEALLLKAQALSRTSRGDEAASTFASVLAAGERAGAPALAVDALVAEAEAMFSAGRVADAMARYHKAIERSDSGQPTVRYRIMVRHAAATAFLAAGALNEALQVLHDALELLPGGNREEPSLAAMLLQRLAEAEMAAGNHEAALRRGEQARAMLSASPAASVRDVLHNLSFLGHALVYAGRPADAVPLLTEGRELAERSGEVLPQDLLPLQAGTALALRASGDPRAALEICDRALAALAGQAADLDRDGGFVEINKERGAALLGLGRLAEALDAFRAAVRCCERLAESQPAALPTVLTDVGTMLLKAGCPAEASTYFRRAWHQRRETLGDDSVPAAQSLDQFAQSWAAMGHPASAIPMYKQALVALRKALGDHPDTAITLFNLGEALIEAGDTSQAVAVLEQAVQIDEAAYGPDHPEVATDLMLLAIALERSQRFEQARQLRSRAERIARQPNGDKM